MDGPATIHILHIEDDAVDAELIRQTLLRSHFKCDITLAVSRQAYQQALQSGGIDLILSDNRGYDFDGLEVLRSVRRRHPEIPFLFLSGSFEGKDLERLRAEGAADCLLKSDLDRLVPAIERALRERPPGRQDLRTRGLEELVAVARDLPLARGPDAIVTLVCRAARRLSGADAACFVLREGDDCHCVGEDADPPIMKGMRMSVSECLAGRAMLDREPVVIEDVQADERAAQLVHRGIFIKSLTLVPIRSGDPVAVIGCLWRSRHRPSEDELSNLRALAEMTAGALENVRIHAELERQLKERSRDLEAVTRELEAFSYSVSHDLRGPLRSVSGFGKLLAQDYEDKLDQAGKNFLAYVTDGTQRISQLVDALLELSRVSRATLTKQAVDLSAMAEQTAAALKAAEPARRCEVQVMPGLTVQADPRLMRVALEQLIGNAWKFSSRRAEARIEVGRAADGGRPFYVRDNGAGFEMAYADKLFTPFQRQHRQDEFEGAGVGLATVQRILRRHGGRIWAEAVEGEGATFFFTLEDAAPRA